jgi:hypothetical protein
LLPHYANNLENIPRFGCCGALRSRETAQPKPEKLFAPNNESSSQERKLQERAAQTWTTDIVLLTTSNNIQTNLSTTWYRISQVIFLCLSNAGDTEQEGPYLQPQASDKELHINSGTTNSYQVIYNT